MDIHAPPPPRPRRTRPSILRCLGATCLCFTLLITLGLSFLAYDFVRILVRGLRDPHAPAFANSTLSADVEVVRPLIDRHTEFDIVLTVWGRVPNNRSTHAEVYLGESAGTGDVEQTGAAGGREGDLRTIHALTGVPLPELRYDPEEVVLYQGVVFEGFTLKSKEREVDVQLELPLERFYDKFLTVHDVRPTFVLVPRSPSPYDKLSSYSDWRPEGAGPLSRLDPSTPLVPYSSDSVAFAALRHTGISLGLVNLPSVPSPCNESGPALSQPILATRSHIYVINETRPIIRTVYDQRHQSLRDGSCRLPIGMVVSRLLCSRTYANNGQWETRLEVASEDGLSQVYYAPFLGSLKNGAGPKHQLRLPVTRAECNGTTRADDPTSINVTYTIRFSTLSPARARVLEDFFTPTQPEHNATALEVASAHDGWVLMGGLLGARQEGSHPWRRLVIGHANALLQLSLAVFAFLYWYTRRTTAGLSLYATWLFAIQSIIGYLVSFAQMADESQGRLFMVFMGIVGLLDLVAPVISLRVTLPVMWKDRSIRRRKWTHRERIDRRLEGEMSWLARLGIFASLTAIFYIVHRGSGIHLISPRLNDQERTTPPSIFNGLTFHSLQWAAVYTALILQAYHNHRRGAFAGQYALTAYLAAVTEMTDLVYHVPSVVGHYETHGGLQASKVVELGLIAWQTWQAWTLPRVEQEVEGEEDEDEAL